MVELLGLEDVEVDEGDFGVVFKKDGTALGFGDPSTVLEMVDLYKKSPEALMLLVSALVSDTPVAKECRSRLADELIRGMTEDDEMMN